ncbi:MAG: hypothetical protein DHS20C16_21440 [Phycisphaerae bacterium]|nr:MAG: hypothetical protein DHS20C16_21440 [Phycisphaerae bacterium]
MNGLRKAKTKIVNCTHCGGANEVAARAMSVFCAHCRKRLILENYIIKSYQAVKGYATCGDVSVEKRGRVAAPIQSNSLTVKGKVNGKVEARGKVEVTSTGSLEGSLKATSLIVVQGAQFDGYCEIRPTTVAPEEPKPAELAVPAQSSTRTTSTNGVKKVSTTSAIKKTTIATADALEIELPAKKTAAKKTTKKKVATKKVAAKKDGVKKVTTRKVAAKKTETKKTPVKKITTRSAAKSSTSESTAKTKSTKVKSTTVKAISTRRKSAAASK